jgi:hypothetical protein
VPGIEAYRISERETPSASTREGVRIVVEPGASITADTVFEALRDGEPSVWVRTSGNQVQVAVGFLADGEAEIVARRLREAFTDRNGRRNTA